MRVPSHPFPRLRRLGLVALAAALGVVACEILPSQPLVSGGDASVPPGVLAIPPTGSEALQQEDGGKDDAGNLLDDALNRRATADGGVTLLEAMRPQAPVPPEAVPPQRELSGVTVDAIFRFRDVPPAPKGSEVSSEGLREAQRLTALTVRADLSDSGRMRMEFVGAAFPFPSRTEVRGRSDMLGHLLLWSSAASSSYRVVPPGSMRTLLGEARVDVTPITMPQPRAQGEGRRLGLPTRKVELVSSLGGIKLEFGRVAEAGDGGALLCRMLMEVAGIDPRTPVCQAGEIPMFAGYWWQEGGAGTYFEVTAIQKRSDLPVVPLLVPPPSAAFVAAGVPAVPNGIFLSREALMAFRLGPVPLAALPTRDPSAPGEGLVAVNRTDRMFYLLVDGIPVVMVPASSERYVIGPPRGRYVVEWRTFLGEQVALPRVVDIPARIVFGGTVDGGAGDAG